MKLYFNFIGNFDVYRVNLTYNLSKVKKQKSNKKKET